MNALTFNTLRMLADGEFRSGEAMARVLGVSRASVWNALSALDECGIEVFKVRGRGYRLAQPLDLLDETEITALLGRDAARFNLEIRDRIDSTNTQLMERARDGAPGGTVLAAEWQTAGRGRRGRTWHALPGAALTFSILWRFEQGAGFLAGLSLATGVAVMRALRAHGADDAKLKWPNDVLWHGRKLAGILIEMQGEMQGPSAAVIGIGINCRLPRRLLERIDQPATDLSVASRAPVERNVVFARLLKELACVFDEFAVKGFAASREEWESYDAYRGKAVKVKLPDGGIVNGVAAGVAENGALLVTTPGGQLRFHSGEVSLRSAH